MPYAVDLFCGAGGFSEGILQAGFNIIFSSDKSKMVMDTYVHRHKQLGLIEGKDTHFELADVRDLTADKIISESNKLKYGHIFKRGNIDAFFEGRHVRALVDLANVILVIHETCYSMNIFA